MESQEMKDVVRRWLKGVFDEGNISLIQEMTTEDYAFRLPRPEVTTRDQLPAMVHGIRTAFPDLNNTFEEQFVEGNVVISLGTSRGTHLGPLGDLPPTGKPFESQWVVFTRFEGDLIAEDREVWDEFGMMMQLGAIPEGG
jgi:predicted ester cyclase